MRAYLRKWLVALWRLIDSPPLDSSLGFKYNLGVFWGRVRIIVGMYVIAGILLLLLHLFLLFVDLLTKGITDGLLR